MNLYGSNEFSDPKTREEPQCKCGAQPRVVRKMMDPPDGNDGPHVRMPMWRAWLDRGHRVRQPPAAAGPAKGNGPSSGTERLCRRGGVPSQCFRIRFAVIEPA